MDPIANERATLEELFSVAQRCGIDFEPIRRDTILEKDRRSLFMWRKVDSIPSTGPTHMKHGTICYNIQGDIKLLPNVLKDSASAFRGGWSESGTFENLEQAVDFVKAWLLDRKEVDDLPQRCVRRYQLVRSGDQ